VICAGAAPNRGRLFEGTAEVLAPTEVPGDVRSAAQGDWVNDWIRLEAERLLSYAADSAEAHDLLVTVIVPGSLVGSSGMPDDVMGEHGKNRVYVTSREGLIPAPEQILVGMRHFPLLIIFRLICQPRLAR
jgi:hypothetical protein